MFVWKTYITRNSGILRFLAEWKNEAVIYLAINLGKCPAKNAKSLLEFLVAGIERH